MNGEPGAALGEELARRIKDAVDAGFDDQIAFLQDLVRRPSLRGQEHLAQDLMFQAMRQRGYEMDRWRVDPKDIEHHPGFSPVAVDYEHAWNVVATHRPRSEAGRSLILNGHIDVVPTGPVEMWADPPFAATIKGDWMYGRGAGDMKAGVVANLFAMDALRRAGLQPAATVHMETVCEEESTGNGALATLVRGYKADAALISEPSGGKMTRAVMGVQWFQVKVRGHPVHVAQAGTGSNAIQAAMDLVPALRKIEDKWNARRHDTRHYGAHAHPVNMNVGKIAGGDWASSVPAWCTMDCRISIYPGFKPTEMQRDIEDAVRQAASGHPFLSNNPPEVVWNGFFTEGYDLEPGSAAETVLSRCHERIAGRKPVDYIATAYIDSRVFVLYGGMPCLVYGPLCEDAHGFDERVNIPSIRDATKAIALFIAEWCGVEPVDA